MKSFIYQGLGFPVMLIGVHTEVIHGEELPILNHADLEKRIFEALLWSTHRLSGAELLFVRGFMRKTQSTMAADIGLKSHSMISQWESKNLEATGMDPSMENAVRMLMANHIGQLSGYAVGRSLEVIRGNLVEPAPVEVNVA
jgi:DNA-binding transcriptional regulator YiaG